MVLESFEKDKINIKNLSIEEPEKQEELPFDPEKEITKKEWQGMKDNLGRLREFKEWRAFLRQATRMKILFPEKLSEYRFGEEAVQGIYENLENNRRAGDWWAFARLAMDMRILFPKSMESFQVINEKSWQGMKTWPRNNWWDYADQDMAMKILLPEKVQELNLDERAWEIMKEQLERFRKDDLRWHSFASLAMAMKILFPEKVTELNLDKNAWQRMKKSFDYYRKENAWDDFSELAMNMKVLAAEEVKVTDQGLEINMRKPRESFKKETPPLPETRNF